MKKKQLEVFLIGVNHKKAPLDVREKLVFRKDEMSECLQNLLEIPEVTEGIILSTCNRTEIYVAIYYRSLRPILEKYFEDTRGFCPSEILYYLERQDAVSHLLDVVCGLDSMILGETQILGQVKDSFFAATEEETVGTILNKLFNIAFVTGKKVHTETKLNEGAVSVAYAGVELAEKIFKDLSHHSVLLLGAGETGELTARHLKKKGVKKLYIANRTEEKARKLAEELEGEALSFLDFTSVLSKVTIVVGAASVENYLIGARESASFPSHPVLFIDLGVPRNFDPKLEKFDNIFLHSVDDLEQIINKNLEKRKDQIPLARKIVQRQVDHFTFWRKSLSVTPTIVALQKKLEQLRQDEMEKYRHHMDDEEWIRVEKITHGLLGKILHSPLVKLKKYCNGTADGLIKVDVVKELFELELGE